MTDKHTPGPWKAIPHGSRIYGPDGYELAATSYEWQRTSTTEANARLIAAAPDMLAVLQTLTREGVSLELYAAAR